jgi:glycine betaine/proline transport system ATP-binding protein
VEVRTDIAVECRHLWKIYGDGGHDALRAARDEGAGKDEILERFDCVVGVADASFEVPRGEIFCIMGLSGSGKSTLIRHINRLIEPTDGDVFVNGARINDLAPKDLRELRSDTIGMVFQHMALWPHRTIRDNVGYGLEVRKVDKAVRYKAADEALAMVKLDGWQNRYPDELSGGMQQRVGLARALAADPEILLMDEPFSALDPLIRRELQDEFLELSRSMDKTTLFITHDLDEAVRMGHRVAIMKDGHIVQQGRPEDIVTRPEGDYVSKFVSSMSTLGFLTAADVIDAKVSADGTNPRVAADTNIRDILDHFQKGATAVDVVGDGIDIGVVTPASVVEMVRRDLTKELA